MEIKGDEFIKRVQVQQEKEELEQKLNELEEVESKISQTSPSQPEPDSVINDQELNNIMLETNTTNEQNKKKYLVLGIVLIVLFLLTIIIIRLLSGDSTKQDEFTADKKDPLVSETKIEDDNIEENFQKIMNDKVKRSNEENNNLSNDTSSEEKINNIEETKISENDLDDTIKKIEEKKKEVVKKVEPKKKEVTKKPEPKKVVKKQEPRQSVKDLVKSVSSTAPKGYFVQVGAFSKQPSQKYINNIRNAKLKYKIYKVEVKGKLYNKVLIGPYSSRAQAKENIESIKSKLNISSAYILKF